MLKKLFLLALLCAGLQLLDSCCDDSKPYFDYKKLLVESDFVRLTTNGDTVLAMTVSPDQIEYLASAQPLRLATPAYGSCADPGDSGPKSPMASVEIFAEQSFNDTLPAGKSLNYIFYDARSNNTSKPIALSDVSDFEFILPQWNFVVYTPVKPKLIDETYSFLVVVTQADGTVAQGRVTGVKFK
jgi:hypothetical protein